MDKKALLEAELAHYANLKKIWPERIKATKEEAPDVTAEEIMKRYGDRCKTIS